MGEHIRFGVELDLDATPIGGQLLAGDSTRSFQGWLDLATGIEDIRSSALETGRGETRQSSPSRPPAGSVEELAERRSSARAWRSRF
jgi:hypothetical protein